MSKLVREQILEKIHVAVRTAFFEEHQKNMQFLADDIEVLIQAAQIEDYGKGYEDGYQAGRIAELEQVKSSSCGQCIDDIDNRLKELSR